MADDQVTGEVASETPAQAAIRLAAEAEAARVAAEVAAAAAAAKKAHDEAIAALAPEHDAALARLDELRSLLQASFAKATAKPDHVGYAQSFVRDVQLKGAEIAAWMQRHL